MKFTKEHQVILTRLIRDIFFPDKRNKRTVVSRGRIGTYVSDVGQVQIAIRDKPDHIYVSFHKPEHPLGVHVAEWPQNRVAPNVRLIYGMPVVLIGETGMLELDTEVNHRYPKG